MRALPVRRRGREAEGGAKEVPPISSQPMVSGKVETSKDDLLPMVEPRSAERRPPSRAPAMWIWIDHRNGSQSLVDDMELLFTCAIMFDQW